MPKNFTGIFAPLTTPFEKENAAPDRLAENIRKYNSTTLAGYVILGSTGESVYLSDDESIRLVSAAMKAAASDKTIIVGTARESTALTIDFTNRMAGLGGDAALIRTPSYFKSRLDDDALKHHFLTIADSSKIPIIVYNIPVHTGIILSPHVVIELSRHSNIIGIKDSSGNLAFLGEVKPYLHEKFHFLLGAASILLPGLIMGADGGIITVSSVAPNLSTELYEQYKNNTFEQAIKTQFSLIPLNKALIQIYGVPAVKYALDLLGFYGGPPRSPLQPLSEQGKREVREILNTLGLID